MSYMKTVENHLKAIQERDLAAYLGTVSKSDVTVILPNGQIVEGYKKVEALHKDWFEDTDWHMEYRIVKTMEMTNIGMTLLDITYTDLDPQGEEYVMRYYLTLTFHREQGNWRLVFDQNTVIK